MEEIILEFYRTNHVNPTHLEKKIEKTNGIHVPHNRIYPTLLVYGLVEINMKKQQKRKDVMYERPHSISQWQGDWKEIEINGTKNGSLLLWMIHPVSLPVTGFRFSNN